VQLIAYYIKNCEGITPWHAMVVKMETKRKVTSVGSQNKE